MIDAGGRIDVNDVKIDFFAVGAYSPWHVDLTPSTVLWLDPEHLLILAWKVGLDSWTLCKLVIDRRGNTIAGPETLAVNEGVGPWSPLLVQGNDGKVYALQFRAGGWAVDIMEVHPRFGRVKAVPISGEDRRELRKWPVSLPDRDVVFTAKGNLLFCWRLMAKSGDDESRATYPRGWGGQPNMLLSYVLDLEGRPVSGPKVIDSRRDAFRRIPGIHLGGEYYDKDDDGRKLNGAVRDLDLSTMSNGDIILSATGLDESGERCVYQVRFSAEGRLVRSKKVQTVTPSPLSLDSSLAVMKVKPAWTKLGFDIGANKMVVRREYVLFGFDEAGNFYEDRILWKEGEE
jgi:hypothetical protein